MKRTKAIYLGMIIVSLVGGYFIGKSTVKTVTTTREVQISVPISTCPKTEELVALDTELFANFNAFNKNVVDILDYAYIRPEGDRFDGTGIYKTNEALNWFYRNNNALLKRRVELLQQI